MGSRAVRELAATPEVEQVVVADYNLEAAEALASEFPAKARALWVDAGDPESVAAVAEGADVVLGAAGPFYKFEVSMAKGAIRAGVNYASLCDDFDAAAAVLALDSEAKEKGVTCITGIGWTPGLSNMLVKLASRELDRVEEARIAWGGSASDSKGYAVILHVLHIYTGLVPSYQDGVLLEVPAGSGRERVRFPHPLGSVTVFNVGHPEPVTIPRYIPGIRTVTLKGGLSEDPLNTLGLAMARLKLTDTPTKKDALGRVIKASMPLLERLGRPAEPMSGVRVDVSGTKDGRPLTLTYASVDHMANLTGVPLAVAGLLLGRGLVEERGVFGPEGALPIGPFFSELKARGVKVLKGVRG